MWCAQRRSQQCNIGSAQRDKPVVAWEPEDWGGLYDTAVLGSSDCPPVAALVSYEDIYVERAFSEGTAALLKGKAEERLKLVFDICDVDHSGRLSHDELRQYLLLVGQVYPSEATNSDPVSAGLKSLLPAASLRG